MKEINNMISYGNGDNALAEALVMAEHSTLIGGTTGSGKSVLVHNILYTLNELSGMQSVGVYLVDPKRVELSRYRNFEWVDDYACETHEILRLVKNLNNRMEDRFQYMQDHNQVKYNGHKVFLIIDELVDISANLETDKNLKAIKRQIEHYMIRIASLGRAANVHIIGCTQRPTADVISPVIKAQFTARVGLRTATPQESINIIDQKGCELLPQNGICYYRSPKYGFNKVAVPYKEEYENLPLSAPVRAATPVNASADNDICNVHQVKNKRSFMGFLQALSFYF